MSRLLREEADHRIRSSVLGTLCLVVAGGMLAAASPWALKRLVDAVAHATEGAAATAASVLPDASVYLLVICASRLVTDLRPLLGGLVDQRIQARLTRRFFDHLMRLPMAYLLGRRGGELLHSLDLAATGCQLVVAHLANSIVPVAVEVVTMTVILVQLGPPALVVLFAVTAALYVAIFATGALRLAKPVHAVSAASLEIHAQLADGIAHAETLRCFCADRTASRALREATTVLEGRWLALNRLNLGIALAASATFALSMAACLWVAAGAVGRGELTVGGFVLASVYMLQMVRPLEVLGSAARDLSRALGFVGPLLDVLAEPLEPAPQAGTSAEAAGPSEAPRAGAPPSVRLEKLRFGYDPQRPVFRDLDLEIRAGSTTALVGRSGSGKSSLARLLMRLYSPQAGRILLDGRPIESLPVIQLRSLIGLVPQDTALLHHTIADNIALGLPEARREDVELAARQAQLQELVEALPRGYDTLVGERGLQLSGGERQRVAIARALLRHPALFILDEPTSMLDSRTEADIQQALRRLTAGCTTLVIAHRLSTVMHADEIVVLDDGQVRERGRHAELLAKGGLYAHLWRRQADGSVGAVAVDAGT